MLGVVLLHKVLHDRTGLEESDCFTVGKGICKGGNTAIGINFGKPILFLDAGLHVDSMNFVWEAGRDRSGQ